jgi:hypothetical protein
LIDHIEYNSERPKLIIPEYGRHIQKMVDQAIAKETKEERNKVASSIIAVMGNLNPHLRDVTDFQHKLWDQLFIISLEYPQNFPKYRFYGNNIKRMIDVAIGWEDGEKKDALVITIANHMKKCFLNWNKDTVEDDVIFNHLFELSEGKLNLKGSEEILLDTMTILKNNKSYGAKKTVKTNKNTKGRTWKKY